MAGGSDYNVASAGQLRGSQPPTKREIEELRLQLVNTMDYANNPTSQQSKEPKSGPTRKSVRFTPSTNFAAGQGDGDAADSTETDMFTQSPVTAVDFPKSLPKVKLVEQPTLETLQPVAYQLAASSSSSDLENLQAVVYLPHASSSSIDCSSPNIYSTSPGGSTVSVKEIIGKFEGQTSSGQLDSIEESNVDLHIDTNDHTHSRSPSGSTISSRRGRRDSPTFEIYFTPVDVTKSEISLSSPVGSPDLSPEDDLPTPRQSRPSTQIYVGDIKTPTQKKDTFKISPSQLDQLVIALATSPMIKKHVQNSWFDIEDVPDDDSMVSLPTLTSASTLYSQQGDGSHGSRGSPHESSGATGSYSGVALVETKTYGSPVRFVTSNYRQGSNIIAIGSRTFLNAPYGPEIECALRVDAPSILNGNVKVLLQCTNQIVDRKSGKKIYVLAVEEDVTERFYRAVIAELAEATSKKAGEIEVSDDLRSPLPTESPDIDWVAVADELQATADVNDTVDNAIAMFAKLDPETCAMESLTLMSSLERIKDQHQDCIVLRPTAFHDNGLPSSMRLPWVSQRLYNDWYEAADGPGYSNAAKGFQANIVANVAKRAGAGEEFTCKAYWDELKMVVHCVPLMESEQGRSDAWACFVLGEFDISP